MLRHLSSGRTFRLRLRTTIGRGPASVMRLRAPRISSEHAVVAHDGERWTVRDLGSRNGTWVGDRRLVPGEVVPLDKGAVIAFGESDDRWQLLDSAPPRLFAEALSGDAVVDAEGGVLALPSSDDPQVMVFGVGDDWIVEDEADSRPARDGDVVVAAGVPWRLAVPERVAGTLAATPQTTTSALVLRVAVDSERQYVRLSVQVDGRWVELAHRAYHAMVLVLAEERVADREASVAERGWLPIEHLADEVGHPPRTLNVHICRLRRQLAAVGVAEAASIIERRAGTGQVRLGTDAVEIGALE